MKMVLLIFLLSFTLAFGYVFVQIPSEKDIKGCITTSMFNVDLCSTSKNYVKLKNISSKLQRAIILTEDSAFYTHNGFDQEGIEHCFEKLKETHRIVCGGSTISQQLAKNLFLSRDKNFIRKGLEALITVKIEKTIPKKEILEKYLNVVQFGKNIFGVKQAAQFYFKKSPAELDVVESAFLAMVLPNPEKYSQSYYRKDLTRFARRRLSTIITNMHKYKSLSDDEYQTGMSKLEYFLTAGQKMPNVNPFELSSDDLNEMARDFGPEPEKQPEPLSGQPVEVIKDDFSTDESTESNSN